MVHLLCIGGGANHSAKVCEICFNARFVTHLKTCISQTSFKLSKICPYFETYDFPRFLRYVFWPMVELRGRGAGTHALSFSRIDKSVRGN